MAQGFYTLEEAARRLGVSTGELNQMAQRREVRAFADRGTWRFRQQDIEELARQRGMGSDAEHQLGDSAAPKKKGGEAAPFELSVDEGADFGTEIFDVAGRKPAPGSDSDVRLVPDVPKAPAAGGSSAKLKGGTKPGSDSDVKLVPQEKQKPPSTPSPKSRPGPRDRDSKLILESDSDIRLTGPEKGKSGDSDVRLDVAGEKGGSRAKLEDSPARLAGMPPGKRKGRGGPDDMTDVEINLDEELAHGAPPRKPKKKSETPAPFELSQDDLDAPGGLRVDPSGSGTDITDVVNLTGSGAGDSSEISLDVSDSGFGKGSGINLTTPSDSGISLEPGAADEIEMPAPSKGKTPRPKKSAKEVAAESSSDFELSIDDSGAPIKEGAADSSEFELNLDESGLAPEEKGEGIFETSLELKGAGEDESSSEVVPLPEDMDAELEGSSEFELAIGEEDEPATVDETGSEVIPIDEEVSDAEATLARPEALEQLEDEQGLDELIGAGEELSEEGAFDYGEGEVEEEAEEETEAAAALALARAPYEQPAEWGVLPMLFLIPTTAVMFLTGFLLFEMLQSVWSYDQPTFFSGKIAEMFGKFLK